MEMSMHSSKAKMEPLCDSVISFLSIHPKVPKSAYHGDPCRLMFIVAQFTTAKIRDPPRCLSIDEQKKSWIQHVYSPVYLGTGRGCRTGVYDCDKGLLWVWKGKENVGERWSNMRIGSKHIIYMNCLNKILYLAQCSVIWKYYLFKVRSPLCVPVVAVGTCRSQNYPQPPRVDLHHYDFWQQCCSQFGERVTLRDVGLHWAPQMWFFAIKSGRQLFRTAGICPTPATSNKGHRSLANIWGKQLNVRNLSRRWGVQICGGVVAWRMWSSGFDHQHPPTPRFKVITNMGMIFRQMPLEVATALPLLGWRNQEA